MMFLKDINLLLSRDKCGMSPILKAAELGHLGVVNMIISKTPQSVKTTDESGRNVLHWAARCRDDEIREQLNSLLREAFKKKKEYKLGNCPKRWEGVNLKTLFFYS